MRSSPDLRGDAAAYKRPNRKQALMLQLAHIKHWFLDSAKRATSPNAKTGQSQATKHGNHHPHSNSHIYHQYTHAANNSWSVSAPRRNSRGNATYSGHRGTPPNRNSLSPQPLTPRSSYRRTSGRGLGGRHSTSSSVSSVRSMHHKTHSKASSTSSASISSLTLKSPRSPRSSVKLLPATPSSAGAFPTHARVVRGGYNEAAVVSGAAFAKRKKSVFKGPTLGLGKRDSSGSRASDKRTGGNIIEEEDEDEEDADEEEDAIVEDCDPEGILLEDFGPELHDHVLEGSDDNARGA